MCDFIKPINTKCKDLTINHGKIYIDPVTLEVYDEYNNNIGKADRNSTFGPGEFEIKVKVTMYTDKEKNARR